MRCYMIELLAAGESFVQRGLIAQIAFDPLEGQPLKILEISSAAGQDPDRNASVYKRANDSSADKTGCPCDESFHREEVNSEA